MDGNNQKLKIYVDAQLFEINGSEFWVSFINAFFFFFES